MIFLTIWAGSLVAAFIIAMAYGFDVGRDIRGSLFLSGLLALVPAAVGYVLVLRLSSLIDRWRVKRGHDVYQEREYEDDAGFIHLNEVPAFEAQEEVKLSEIVSGMEPILERPSKDSDDSEEGL
jgi:hypothetical protein